MADLIYRKDAIKAIIGLRMDASTTQMMWDGDVRAAIEDIPAVKAAHGRWERRNCGPNLVECKCSACGFSDFVFEYDRYWFNRNYCPYCGAKMDGKRRNDEWKVTE